MTAAQISDVMSGTPTLDVTAEFNNAVNSGHGAFMTGGVANIEGTILLDSEKSLLLNNECVLQRFSGASIEPIVHLISNNNALDGGGAAVIRQNLYDHPYGIVLVGSHPLAAAGTPGDRATRNCTVRGVKIIGPENSVNELETGSPGIYVHSNGRKLGAFTSSHTFKCQFYDNEIVNCDVLMEFSSDANSHYVSGLYFHQWIKAAIFFNAAYGNVFDGVMMETALENIVPSGTKRYAMHFAAQNAGVETGTDALYTFDAATENVVKGYAELTNGGNTNISLLDPTETGTVFGENVVKITGVLSGGIGTNGSSSDADVGTNNDIEVSAIKIYNRNNIRQRDHNIRALDDGSGSYSYKDSTAVISGRSASIAASTQEDIFSVDNIGLTQAGILIDLSFTGKADVIRTVMAGKILWVARILNTATYNSVKISDFTHSFAASRPLEFNITLAAGTTANTMKVTVGFLTSATVGNRFVGWKAEITSANEQGTLLDWDNDISLAP